MANRQNRKRTRETREPLYDRSLQRVRWASDTALSFPIVPEGLNETATWLKEVVGPLESLNSYGFKEVTKHPSSWLTMYGRRHLARLLIERYERLAYFDLEVTDEFAHKVDIDFYRRPADEGYLAFALGETFMSILTSWNGNPPRVDRRCVPYTHLCELEQGIPWTAVLEEVHAGMNAEHIQRVLRAPRTLSVIPPTVVLDQSNQWVLDPCRRNAQGDFVARELPPQHAWREQITAYTPLSWRQFERMRRHKYQLLVGYHEVEIDCFYRHVVPDIYESLPSWWHEVEVPYGFFNEMPPVVAYRSSYFRKYQRYQTVLRSGWAYSVARHLTYEARAGRLWWIPPAVREDIRAIGLTSSHSEADNRWDTDANKLTTLLECIDRTWWSTLPKDGVFPEYPATPGVKMCGALRPAHNEGCTPVHDGCDWVVFNPVQWTLQIPDRYMVGQTKRGKPLIEDPRPDYLPPMSTGRTASKSSAPTNAIHMAAWRRQQLAKLTSGTDDVQMEEAPPAKKPKLRSVPAPKPAEGASGSSALLDALKAFGVTNVAELQARLGSSTSAMPTTSDAPNLGADAKGATPALRSGDATVAGPNSVPRDDLIDSDEHVDA